MHRLPGRILLITAAFALFLVPIAAIAAGGFEDVGDDNVFKADIQWLADAGVTKGCNPPANTKFCPGDNVTREQMSAFMHRLAVNKVVDAKTAVTATNATNATNAANSDKLDGMDSAAFKSRVASDTVAFADAIAVPANVDTAVLSVTGFDVPGGGAITATTANLLSTGVAALAVIWIEVDGSGACDTAAPQPSAQVVFIQGSAPPFVHVPIQTAAALSQGSHRVDLCVLSSQPTGAMGSLIVEWHESVSSAGILSDGGGLSPAELMNSVDF